METYETWFSVLFDNFYKRLAQIFEQKNSAKKFNPFGLVSFICEKEPIGCINAPDKIGNHSETMEQIFSTSLLWDNGSTLYVHFMDDSNPKRDDKVLGIAKIWEKYANITFKKATTREEKDKA